MFSHLKSVATVLGTTDEAQRQMQMKAGAPF